MKILRVSSDLYPFVVGGIGVHVHEMSKLQSEMGYKNTVLAAISQNDLKKKISVNYHIQFFNSKIKIFGNTIDPFLFLKLLRNQKKYNIIHSHSHLFFHTIFCVIIKIISSSSLIVTTHGLIGQTAPKWLNKIYFLTISLWIFHQCDKIISYTDVEKNQLINYGIPAEKIEVIHNGINTHLFCPDLKYSSYKQILWIGRFVPGKGVEHLIDAFKLFNSKYPDYHLLLIGWGPQKNLIKQKIIELDLKSSITFQEYVSNEDLPITYKKSDIFVLPSLKEGVPRTILEAMSCGVPVVCTELPQLVDIVEGSGILVPMKDSESLANAMIKIIENSELSKKYGENGRNRVVKDFSWEDTVWKTLTLYQEVVLEKKKERFN